MSTIGLRFGFVGCLALAMAACTASTTDPANESSQPTDAPKQAASDPPATGAPKTPASPPQSSVPGENGDDNGAIEDGAATLVAELTLAVDHTLRFTEISELGGTPNILVAESHPPAKPSALHRLPDLAAKDVTARDVFFALSKKGTAIPARLMLLDPAIKGQAQGWGLDKLEKITAVINAAPSAAATNACENGSFTASTYGGILPSNDAWLDRHPGDEYSQYLYTYYGPSGLTQVSSPRFSFTLARNNIRQYRGKVCFETIEGAGLPLHRYYDNGQDKWVNLDPIAAFHYRTAGSTTWKVADSVSVPVGQTRLIEWAWFGYNNQEWDWRVQISRAQEQDYVDYMRSYLD